MYGIFTYKTGCFLGQMLVNIPAPWSIWESQATDETFQVLASSVDQWHRCQQCSDGLHRNPRHDAEEKLRNDQAFNRAR